MASIVSVLYHFVPRIENATTDLVAGIFFINSIETEDIVSTYKQASVAKKKKEIEKVKILIVPGHDNVYSGAEFQGTREADLNLQLGIELQKLLSRDKAAEVFMIRDANGYNPEFNTYLEENHQRILTFREEKKRLMETLVDADLVKSYVNVHHNTARPEVSSILYGINMFASEQGYDIVLHIHFNDYPGRKGSGGKYSGFSIYIPEKQYSNADASYDLALRLKDQLLRVSAESDLPNEEAITEDQELIAVGAFNTLDPAVALIEYGYIYESQFTDPLVMDDVLRELARQTYYGITEYLQGGESVRGDTFEGLDNVHLSGDIVRGERGVKVLTLQDRLRDLGYYPIDGDLNACPMSGRFGPCTENALKVFQKDRGLPTTGIFGEKTRRELLMLHTDL